MIDTWFVYLLYMVVIDKFLILRVYDVSKFSCTVALIFKCFKRIGFVPDWYNCTQATTAPSFGALTLSSTFHRTLPTKSFRFSLLYIEA